MGGTKSLSRGSSPVSGRELEGLDLDFADDELLLKEVTSSAAVAETVDAVVGAFLFRFGLSEWKSSLLISLQIIHDS